MTRISLAIVLTLLTLTQVLAQQRTYYGVDGKAAARSTTDSQGTTTLYGSDGRAITRETNTRSGTTIYDARSGRAVGKVTKEKQ